MSDERFFLDTVFIQALLNKRDQYHHQAKAFLPRVRTAMAVWVTEAVLVEVGNALGAVNRPGAVQFIQQCYNTTNLQVVTVDTSLPFSPSLVLLHHYHKQQLQIALLASARNPQAHDQHHL
jgi:uncharacterized protein with PIN domain